MSNVADAKRAPTRNINAPGYTIAFAVVVALVCATLVSVAAVLLKPMQDANARFYMEKNVLIAAGLVQPGDALSLADLDAIFDAAVVTRLIDLPSGDALDVEPAQARRFDQRLARNDPATSAVAPANDAGVRRLPDRAPVYLIMRDGGLDQVVIPVDGLGMWGTVYGFLALAPDASTVRGITYYEHRETPGLGAEISNPEWQDGWVNRKIYDEDGAVAISVLKGQAGPPETDPFHVDGLAGATVTGNALTRFMHFWLDEHGFRPFLDRVREGEFS